MAAEVVSGAPTWDEREIAEGRGQGGRFYLRCAGSPSSATMNTLFPACYWLFKRLDFI